MDSTAPSDEMQEESVDGLTQWDMQQSPRPVIKDTVLSRPVRTINAELTCPICLRVFHNPVVVRECLHRFCSECIEKCLRIGRKECPSCRIHIPSRRSLRPDSNFAALISKIYPNLEEYEEQEERLIEDLNKNRNLNNAFTQSCRQGIANQLRRRKNTTGGGDSREGGKRSAEDSGLRGGGAKRGREDLAHFILRRHLLVL